MHRLVLVLAGALIVSSALAANNGDADKSGVIEKPVVADTPDTFTKQAAWIEQEMQPDGRYEFAKPADRQRVRALLTQMGNLLQRAGSVASMDQQTKVELFNDQEEINGILKHNDANRLVCESRQPIGSHIPVTHCHTFRQQEETARNTQIGLRQFDHSQLCNGASAANNCIPASMAGSSNGH